MTINNYDTVHYIYQDSEKFPKPVCSVNGFYHKTTENINEVTCNTCKKVYQRIKTRKEKKSIEKWGQPYLHKI